MDRLVDFKAPGSKQDRNVWVNNKPSEVRSNLASLLGEAAQESKIKIQRNIGQVYCSLSLELADYQPVGK